MGIPWRVRTKSVELQAQGLQGAGGLPSWNKQVDNSLPPPPSAEHLLGCSEIKSLLMVCILEHW